MTMKISYTIRNKEIRVCLNFVERNDYIIHARDIISFANIPPPPFFFLEPINHNGSFKKANDGERRERKEKRQRAENMESPIDSKVSQALGVQSGIRLKTRALISFSLLFYGHRRHIWMRIY